MYTLKHLKFVQNIQKSCVIFITFIHGFDLIKILYCRFTRFCDVLPLFYKSIQYLETFVSHLLLLPFYACIHLFKHVLFVCTDYIKTVFIINQQCLFLYIPIHV